MNMKTKLLVCFGSLLCVAASSSPFGWPLARLTVQVRNEDGEVVSGAKVQINFRERLSDRDARVVGETDRQGKFAGEGYSDRRLGATVTKEAYYDSGAGWTIFKDPLVGKWQPWDPVAEVVLRPIGKPVPLAVKRVRTHVPVLDVLCGYDLQKGDWVAPYGKGAQSDFTFKVSRDYKDWFNFTVEAQVTFPQQLDGLLRMKAPPYGRNSVFCWERNAPETGYVAPHAIRFVNHDPRTDRQPERTFDPNKEREQGYFFRVRTVEENGKIIAANYGKITDDIGIEPRDSKTCQISFTYYFNPASLDRNVEWDPKRNLLPGLTFEETPQSP